MKKHSCYRLFFEKLVLKMHFGMSFLRTFDFGWSKKYYVQYLYSGSCKAKFILCALLILEVYF